MTEQEQRISIAEACGFQRWFGGNDVILCKPRDNRQRQHWLDSGSVIVDRPVDSMREVPDYLNDLNAMHEAEKSLNEDQVRAYHDHLMRPLNFNCFRGFRATAAQRAEAFLRTISKWKDTP